MKLYNEMKLERAAHNETRDCGVISLALVCEVTYAEAHAALKKRGRKDRQGTWAHQMTRAAKSFGKKVIKEEPVKPNGGRYTPLTIGAAYPKGRYLVRVSGHLLALIDGQVEDWTAGRRHHITDMWRIK